MEIVDDVYFMNKAYEEAKKAFGILEAPIGAVIVKDGEIVASGYNQKEKKQDPTAHAEMIAIQEAAKKLGTWRLHECDMYVTLEPCTMCAGAMVQARIRKVFIGTKDEKAGGCGSVFDIINSEKLNHRVQAHYGVMETECSTILKSFFKGLRDGTIKKAGKKNPIS